MEGVYKAEKRETVAEAPGLRVRRITLAPGESVPWHHHSNIADTFFCLDGTVVVETRAHGDGPAATHVLAPGDSVAIPPKTAHYVHGRDMGRCKFLTVQGVGDYDFVAEKG